MIVVRVGIVTVIAAKVVRTAEIVGTIRAARTIGIVEIAKAARVEAAAVIEVG